MNALPVQERHLGQPDGAAGQPGIRDDVLAPTRPPVASSCVVDRPQRRPPAIVRGRSLDVPGRTAEGRVRNSPTSGDSDRARRALGTLLALCDGMWNAKATGGFGPVRLPALRRHAWRAHLPKATMRSTPRSEQAGRGRLHGLSGLSELLLGRRLADVDNDEGRDMNRHITVREREISPDSSGRSNKEIANALGCAIKTVECHVTCLLRKFNVDSRLRLALTEQFRLGVSSDSDS